VIARQQAAYHKKGFSLKNAYKLLCAIFLELGLRKKSLAYSVLVMLWTLPMKKLTVNSFSGFPKKEKRFFSTPGNYQGVIVF
jgi:hypothetical protein